MGLEDNQLKEVLRETMSKKMSSTSRLLTRRVKTTPEPPGNTDGGAGKGIVSREPMKEKRGGLGKGIDSFYDRAVLKTFCGPKFN